MQVSNMNPTGGLSDISFNNSKAKVFNNEMYFGGTRYVGGSAVLRLYKITTNDVITQVVGLNASTTTSDWPFGLVVYKDELYFSSQVFSSPGGWSFYNTYKINTSGKINKVLDMSMIYGVVFDGSLYFTGKGKIPGSSSSVETRFYKLTKSP